MSTKIVDVVHVIILAIQIFVPIVLLIAFITFVVWISVSQNLSSSLNRAISVLVISFLVEH